MRQINIPGHTFRNKKHESQKTDMQVISHGEGLKNDQK
jgi:hypothetical protein